MTLTSSQAVLESTHINPLLDSVQVQRSRLLEEVSPRFNLNLKPKNVPDITARQLEQLRPGEEPLLVMVRSRGANLAIERPSKFFERMLGYLCEQEATFSRDDMPLRYRLLGSFAATIDAHGYGLRTTYVGFNPASYFNTSLRDAARSADRDGVQLAGVEVIRALLWNPHYLELLQSRDAPRAVLGSLRFIRNENSCVTEVPFLRYDEHTQQLKLELRTESTAREPRYAGYVIPTMRQLSLEES